MRSAGGRDAQTTRDVGALLDVADRDDDVRLLDEIVGHQSRPPIAELDADRAHDVDDTRVHAVAGTSPGRQRRVPASGRALQQRGGHRRVAGVELRDEENRCHVRVWVWQRAAASVSARGAMG
jgi:hypothetical protein